MEYSTNKDQVIFLKDTDIVQDISGNNEAGISTTAVTKNGIASYDLVSAISGTTSADVKYLSGELSDLSGKFAIEKNTNISAMRYKGEVTLNNVYLDLDGEIEILDKLAALLKSNPNIGAASAKLSAGYLFKAKAGEPISNAYDFGNGKILHPNDYIFLKNDVNAVSNVTFNDINIIYDYDLSVKNLSTQVDVLETTVSASNTGLISKLSTLSVNLLNEDPGTEQKPNELGLIPKISNDLSTLSVNLLNEDVENRGKIPQLSIDLSALSGSAGLSAKKLSDAITGISDVISAENIGLSAQVTSISSSVITDENSLSNKVNNLSIKLLNEDPGTEEDPKTIGLIPDLRSDVELSAKDLSDAITAIRSDVKGGVNYKGHLKLNMFDAKYDLSTYVALLHGGSYSGETITITDEVKNKELNNGWMYYISLTGNEVNPPPSSYTTNDGIKFVPGNYIIVHAHNVSGDADTSLSSVKVCDIKRENIDIIQVTDTDLVRFQNLNAVSNALCTSTTALVSSISNTLSDALTTHIGDYNQLCTTLSTSISTLSIDVHTTVSNAIDNKVQLSVLPENGTGTPITSTIGELIINRMSIQQYETLARNGQVRNDQIYVINDDNQSLFGHDISNVNDIQAVSGHINTLSVGSLTAADVVQASELNVIGDAGTVNVANVNAANQISVGEDAFVANSNGNVTTKNLTAKALSVQTSLTVDNSITANNSGLTTNNILSGNALVAKTRIVLNNILTADTNGIKSTADISAKSLSTVDITATTTTTTTANATTANIDTVNATTANLTNITATQTTTGTLAVQDSYVVADKLTANSAGLSIDGNLSVKSNMRAGNISATTISATDQIIVDGKLTATNDGITANGKLSTNNDLDVARNLSVGSTSLSANGLSVDSNGIKTPNLTATTISTQTLTVANSIQLFNDSYGISRDGSDNALNIRTFDGTTDNPKLKINGKLFKQYYAEYLSNDYLSDGYIDSVTVGTSAMNGNTVWGLKFAWNDIAGKDPTFIPLSSLGGIYEGDGRIISIDKTNPNEFKINASPEAISNAISMALSNAFGIQDIKDELSNKVLIQNGIDAAQKVQSLTIHKMSLAQYKGMSQDQRVSSDIYVIEDNNIDAFGGKVTNLAEPTDLSDAANKQYVDSKITELNADAATSAAAALTDAKGYTDGEIEDLNTTLVGAIGTAKSEAITAAKDYTDQVSGVLDTSIDEKIQYKAGTNSQPTNIETLTIQKITAADYSTLTIEDKNRNDVIYSITDANYNMFGNKIVSLADPTDLSDAANKKYVDSEIAKLNIAAETSASNTLAEAKTYADGKISELNTAAATSVDTALAEAKQYTDDEINGLNTTLVGAVDTAKIEAVGQAQDYTDEVFSNKIKYKVGDNDPVNIDTLTIHKMSLSQYKGMASGERADTDIYVIDDANIDAFGGKVTNLAEPTASNDATTKNYVDSQIAETKGAISGHITFEKLENPANIVLKINDLTAASFSYADFVKDSVLDDVALSLDHGTSVLVFSFKSADDDIDPIPVALSSFANLYEAGSYVTLNKKTGDDNIQKINVDYSNLFTAINGDIQTALIGNEAGDTWASPGYNKPIYLLSAAIKSDIKRSIDDVDLSALYGGDGWGWNNPKSGTPIATLSNGIRDTILNNDIKSTLVGPLDGNTWTQPAEAAPLGQLSSVLNTAIRANIVSMDLTSLHGAGGDWSSPTADSPLYQLSTALDEKIRENITSTDLANVLISADDWTTPDSNSPLGIVSSNIVSSIKSSITSAELSALFVDENEQGSWTAPGIDSPLQQFKASLTDTYALSNDVSNYVSSVVSDYQLATDMSAYVEKSLFSSFTTEADILSISTDDLSDVTTPADVSALSSKLNELIEKVNSIKNILSGIGFIPPTPEPEEPEAEEP